MRDGRKTVPSYSLSQEEAGPDAGGDVLTREDWHPPIAPPVLGLLSTPAGVSPHPGLQLAPTGSSFPACGEQEPLQDLQHLKEGLTSGISKGIPTS